MAWITWGRSPPTPAASCTPSPARGVPTSPPCRARRPPPRPPPPPPRTPTTPPPPRRRSTPAPSPSVSVGPATFSQTPSPGTSVLGLSQTRGRTLPVTGSNPLPFLLFAAMCYAFGAVALKVASRRKGVAQDPEEDASE